MKNSFNPQNAKVRFNKVEREIVFEDRVNRFVGFVIQTVALAMFLGIAIWIVSLF